MSSVAQEQSWANGWPCCPGVSQLHMTMGKARIKRNFQTLSWTKSSQSVLSTSSCGQWKWKFRHGIPSPFQGSKGKEHRLWCESSLVSSVHHDLKQVFQSSRALAFLAVKCEQYYFLGRVTMRCMQIKDKSEDPAWCLPLSRCSMNMFYFLWVNGENI